MQLPAGDRRVKLAAGAGHILVYVPEDVCVASTAELGMGGVFVFDRAGGGIDVDWSDERRAPAGTPRLVLDGDIGLGALEVRHDEDRDDDFRRGPGGRRFQTDDRTDERNSACATRSASSGASNG